MEQLQSIGYKQIDIKNTHTQKKNKTIHSSRYERNYYSLGCLTCEYKSLKKISQKWGTQSESRESNRVIYIYMHNGEQYCE